MTTRVGVEDTNSLDDLELELRKLPGVRAAGFEEHDEMLLVQLHVGDGAEAGDQPMPVAASRIAARHSHRQVAVEIVRWREPVVGGAPAAPVAPAPLSLAPSGAARSAETGDGTERRRPRLLAVLAFPDTDELEVHLIHDGKRTIGRAAASGGLVAAVEATIDAIRELGASLEPRPRWARALDDNGDDRSVVAVALEGVDDPNGIQYGLAAGASPIDAAARSTLDALNRKLTHVL